MTALMKYIFLDVVGYSHNRTVEAQVDIVSTLNSIVKECTFRQEVEKNDVIFLPTGDGICIAFINQLDPFDLHLTTALGILKRIAEYNNEQPDEKRKFEVRIGINENDDNMITDINGNQNVAGSGINFAQRVMDAAGARQILVSESVHEKLVQRERYFQSFLPQPTMIKHGIQKQLFRYLNPELSFLDSSVVASVTEENLFSNFSSIYAALVHLLDSQIVEISDGGVEDTVLFILICYMADDITEYRKRRMIERPKFTSKIFPSKTSNLFEAFAALDASPSWVLFDCKDFLLQERNLSKWADFFKKDYLFLTPAGKNKLDAEKPKLLHAVEIFLSQIYPNLTKKKAKT